MKWGNSRGCLGGSGWSGNQQAAGGQGKWWTCPVQECKDSLHKIGRKPWVNSPKASVCGHCELPWAFQRCQQDAKLAGAQEALKVKLAEKAKHAGNDGAGGAPPSKSQLKKRKAAAAKEEAARLELEALEEEADEPDEEVLEVTLDLPPRLKELKKALQMPRDLDEDWGAGKVVAKLAPKDGAAEVDRLNTALEQNRAALALDDAILGTKIDRAGIAKRITALEKDLAKATKDSVGAKLTAKQLEVAKQAHEDGETARVLRAETATTTAAERLEEIEQICLGHIAAWEKFLDSQRAQATARDTAWAQLRQTLSERAILVAEVFDAEILQAHTKAGTPTPAPAPAAPTVDLSLADAVAEVAKLKAQATTAEADKEAARAFAAAETAELLSKIRALENNAKPAAAPTLSPLAMAQCSVAVQWQKEELPQMKAKPDKACKKLIVLLGTNVNAWARNGQIPITFSQLLIGVDNKFVDQALAVLKDITGKPIWERFFAQDEIVLGAYVPFQLGTVLQASLQMAEAALVEFGKDYDFADAAQKSFGAYYAEDATNKRQRCGPYAA